MLAPISSYDTQISRALSHRLVSGGCPDRQLGSFCMCVLVMRQGRDDVSAHGGRANLVMLDAIILLRGAAKAAWLCKQCGSEKSIAWVWMRQAGAGAIPGMRRLRVSHSTVSVMGFAGREELTSAWPCARIVVGCSGAGRESTPCLVTKASDSCPAGRELKLDYNDILSLDASIFQGLSLLK